MSKLLFLAIIFIATFGNIRAEKYDMKVNLEVSTTSNYEVTTISEVYKNKEFIKSDTTVSNSQLEVVAKNDLGYEMLYSFDMLEKNKNNPLNQIQVNLFIEYSGNIKILNKNSLYEAMIKKMTAIEKYWLLLKDTSNLEADQIEKKYKQELESIDSRAKAAITKEMFFTIIQSKIDLIDLSDYYGVEIGKARMYESVIPYPLFGDVKSIKKVRIKKDDTNNTIKITSLDSIDIADMYTKMKENIKEIDSSISPNIFLNSKINIARQYQIDKTDGFIKNQTIIKTAIVSSNDGLYKHVEKTFMIYENESVKEKNEKNWISDFSIGLALAKKEKKAVLIDFTGYTCTSCRWMENRMFTKPGILDKLKNMIKIRLFTDKMGEPFESNKKMQEEKFGSSELPLYVLLTPDGEFISSNSFTRDEAQFLEFLDKGLNAVK